MPEDIKKRNKQMKKNATVISQERRIFYFRLLVQNFSTRVSVCVPRTAILHFTTILKTAKLERFPPAKYVAYKEHVMLRYKHFIGWLIMH